MWIPGGITSPLVGPGGPFYVRFFKNGDYIIVPRARADRKSPSQLEQRRRLAQYTRFASKVHLPIIKPLTRLKRRTDSAWSLSCQVAMLKYWEQNGHCMSPLFEGPMWSYGTIWTAYEPETYLRYIQWSAGHSPYWDPLDKCRVILYCQDPFVLWYSTTPLVFGDEACYPPQGVWPVWKYFNLYLVVWKEENGKVLVVNGDYPRTDFVWW